MNDVNRFRLLVISTFYYKVTLLQINSLSEFFNISLGRND
jgi:hypothetical protein